LTAFEQNTDYVGTLGKWYTDQMFSLIISSGQRILTKGRIARRVVIKE